MKSIDIEKLLSWTFREELPKGLPVSTTPWAALERHCVYGTPIDDWVGSSIRDALGSVPGEPHEDARTIGAAVRSLKPIELQWPEAREIVMGDLAPITPKSLERVRLTIDTDQVVLTCAIMGTRPVWDLGRPELHRVLASKGQVRIENGYSYKKGVYTTGSTCPLAWEDPRPQDIALSRFEYMVWHAALSMLAHSLSGVLVEHEPLPPSARPAPWKTGQVEPPRVLRSMVAA